MLDMLLSNIGAICSKTLPLAGKICILSISFPYNLSCPVCHQVPIGMLKNMFF